MKKKKQEEDMKKKKEALLDKPWRMNKKNGWKLEEVTEMRNDIIDFKIRENSEIEHFNVLILGTPSSGKTALRNTIGSVFSEDILRLAYAGHEETSLTKKLTAYPVRNNVDGKNKKIPIKFWDTMGLDDHLPTDNICKILDGLVKNGTLLEGNLDGGQTRSDSETKHKMHCILFVVNATKLALLKGTQEMLKIKDIIQEANKRGLPSLLVLTHVDKICAHMEADTAAVFKSLKIRTLIETAEVITSFPKYKIHPIRNYTDQGDKVTAIDFLTLLLLKQVTGCCREYCDFLEDANEDY